MTATHNADSGVAKVNALVALQEQQRTLKILCHGGGIAPWTVGPANAYSLQVVGVDMVETNGGSSNKLHAAAFEQQLVTTCSGTDDERIGITDIVRTDFCPSKGYHLVGEVL